MFRPQWGQWFHDWLRFSPQSGQKFKQAPSHSCPDSSWRNLLAPPRTLPEFISLVRLATQNYCGS